MNELIEQIYSQEITQKGIDDLAKRYPKNLKIDMSQELEFKTARKTRTERNKLVEAINRRRIDITAELKTTGDEIIETVNEIYDVVVLPFEAEDTRRKDEALKEAKEKEEKLNKEQKEIQAISDFYTSSIDLASDKISGVIEAVDLIEVDYFDKDLIHEAIEVKRSTLEKLGILFSDAKNREAVSEEREKLAKENLAIEMERSTTDRINALRMIPTTMFGASSEVIQDRINSVNNFSVTITEFGAKSEEAKSAISLVIDQLETMKQNQKLVEQANLKSEPDKINQNHEQASYKSVGYTNRQAKANDVALECAQASNVDRPVEPPLDENAQDSEEDMAAPLNPFHDWFATIGAEQVKMLGESGEDFKYRLCKMAYNAGENAQQIRVK